MVFQNPDNQIVGTLVDEEVGFGPENIGVPTEEIWERVEKSLKAVGMYAFRNQSPNKLSGGQKQRVAIAGIVAMKPKCIVLDEPTAMLDPLGRKDVLNVLHELNRQENVTVILITHYMEEVIDIDKLYVMDDGKLVMSGTPREIFSQVENMVDDFARRIQSQGLSMEQYMQFTGATVDSLKEQMKPQAVKRIESRLVLEKVAEAENIQISDEKLDEELAKMAEMYKMELDKFKELVGEYEKEQMKKDLAVQEAVTLMADSAKEA